MINKRKVNITYIIKDIDYISLSEALAKQLDAESQLEECKNEIKGTNSIK